MDAGAEPIAAVPTSFWLRAMTTDVGHKIDIAAIYMLGWSFISWEASRLRGIAYQPSLLLTTTGRKSGKRRTSVLPYVRHAADYIVVGSNAGRARNPMWVENARANPQCRIRVARRTIEAHAHIAEDDERAALLPVVAAKRPHIYNYDAHAARHGRRAELVVITPVST
ncbi:hypothetical protein U91I_01379 [alpha proteobacterium U9-1i]|nr:hypothetical protein U91I_01379 [alpha proteobacterium U9-1i]